MPVRQVFDDFSQPDEHLFAQGLEGEWRRIFQACAKLLERLPVSPCAVMGWTSDAAHADCHPGVELLAALRTVDRLDVLAAQPFDDLGVALAGPTEFSRAISACWSLSPGRSFSSLMFPPHTCLFNVYQRGMLNLKHRVRVAPQRAG
jgi:hypothetical protein